MKLHLYIDDMHIRVRRLELWVLFQRCGGKHHRLKYFFDTFIRVICRRSGCTIIFWSCEKHPWRSSQEAPHPIITSQFSLFVCPTITSAKSKPASTCGHDTRKSTNLSLPSHLWRHVFKLLLLLFSLLSWSVSAYLVPAYWIDRLTLPGLTHCLFGLLGNDNKIEISWYLSVY